MDIALWAFSTAALVSSQKEPIEALSLPLALEPLLKGVISSKEEVGKAGRWGLDLTTGKVTMGSSLGGSLSLWCFLIRSSPVKPALAFFS